MAGIFNYWLLLPRYTFVWYVQVVLNIIKKYCGISNSTNNQELTYKLCMLLSLTTASRISTPWETSIYHVCTIFWRNNFSDTLISKCMCPYQEVKNVRFSKNFAFALNWWSLMQGKWQRVMNSIHSSYFAKLRVWGKVGVKTILHNSPSLDMHLDSAKERRLVKSLLWLSFQKPFKEVVNITISSWIQWVLRLAKIDTEIY